MKHLTLALILVAGPTFAGETPQPATPATVTECDTNALEAGPLVLSCGAYVTGPVRVLDKAGNVILDLPAGTSISTRSEVRP